MTPEQIDIVRKSFDSIWPVRRKLADLFYSRFFELAPDTRRLFSDDMERQQLKLMDMIATIVGTLDKGEIFQSIISHSGRRGETVAFRCVWRRVDMGPGTAIWRFIYSRDERSLDQAL
jgi:hypothetical protein